jgi:hypothetical protein
MITNLQEINKEYRLAMKHFKKAIELAKKSIVVGEINFPTPEKKVRAKKVKVTPGPQGKDLPEDKSPFYEGKKGG